MRWKEKQRTHPAVHLVLLHFALRLYHEKRVVEQEHHEVSAVSLRIPTLLECAFVDQLAALLFQS